jgi:hypothetical protein
MERPLKEVQSSEQTVWVTKPHELRAVIQRAKTALNVARGKYMESQGNLELVMQTAEAFGRGLFAELIKKKPKEWTMKQWLEVMTREVLNPLGSEVTFTKITENEAKSIMFRSPLVSDTNDPAIATLFTYGFMRGMFRSAFPQGELLMESTTANDAPMTGFTFKSFATDDERAERERVKSFFATTMKIEK